MSIRITPYTSELIDGVAEFNKRMRQANAPSEFLLPEEPPLEGGGPDRAIKATYFLAVEEGTVRGGFVRGDYPGWLNGAAIQATICIAPLSEGIIDPKYSMLAMQFVRHLRGYNPYGFASGMGSPNNPYPRLLRAAGWAVLEVPFFFLVCNPRRFLRQIAPLRASPVRRIASAIAAWTGLGSLAMLLLQSRALTARRSTWSVENFTEWNDWADEIWLDVQASISFAIRRDRKTLQDLYPPSESRLIRLLIRDGDRIAGWATALDTQMKGDRHFGNLRVITILDCMARPADLTEALLAVRNKLRSAGADLIISNQSHASWRRAFRQCGFLKGPTNFCLGLSKNIAEATSAANTLDSIYFTRGDGDGRMHL